MSSYFSDLTDMAVHGFADGIDLGDHAHMLIKIAHRSRTASAGSVVALPMVIVGLSANNDFV